MTACRRSVTIMPSTGTQMNAFSEVAKSDSYYGYTDGFHTIQVTYHNYVGRFRIQATLALEPEEDDWFDLVIDPNSGLYIGSTPWNPGGFVQFNSNRPGNGSEGYSFTGNFTFVRAFMDRRHVADGETYNLSYGEIKRVILSS